MSDCLAYGGVSDICTKAYGAVMQCGAFEMNSMNVNAHKCASMWVEKNLPQCRLIDTRDIAFSVNAARIMYMRVKQARQVTNTYGALSMTRVC